MAHWIILCLYLLVPWLNGGKGVESLTIIQLAIFSIAGISIYRYWRQRNSVKLDSLKTPLILFLISLSLSIANSIYLYNSLKELCFILALVMLYVILINLDRKNLKNIFYAIIIITLCESFIGIIQAIYGFKMKGTFPNQNFLANMMMIGIVIALGRVFWWRGWHGIREIKAKSRLLYMLLHFSMLVPMGIVLLLTGSRGGILSLLIALFFLVVIRFGKKGFVSFICIVILGTLLLGDKQIYTFTKLDRGGPNYNLRLNIWESTIKIMTENPFFGVGPGNFSIAFAKHKFPIKNSLARYERLPRFAHNEYLQIGSELGILSLAVFIYILFILLRAGYKKYKICNFNEKQVLAISLCVVIGILTQAFVDFILHLPIVSMIFLFFASFIGREMESEESIMNNTTFRILGVTIVVLSIFVLSNFLSYAMAKKENYKSAARFMPLDADNYVRMAERQKENPSFAILNLSKAIALKPYDATFHEGLGILFHKMESPDLISALREYKDAVKYSPYNPFFRYNLATYFYIRGEYDRARDIYVETLKIEPYYLMARYQLALSLLKLGEYERAKSEFSQIIMLPDIFKKYVRTNTSYETNLLEFDFALVYSGLGRYFQIAGDRDKSLKNYRRALEINPYFAEVYNELSGIYFKQGEYGKAREMLYKALEIEPESEIYLKNLKRLENRKK